MSEINLLGKCPGEEFGPSVKKTTIRNRRRRADKRLAKQLYESNKKTDRELKLLKKGRLQCQN